MTVYICRKMFKNIKPLVTTSSHGKTMKKISAIASLLLTTFFWGITFTIVKDAVARVDVFVFLAQRFLAAFAMVTCICLVRKSPLDLKTLRSGALLGLFLFGSYAFQTVALLYTTASNTGFLTGLSVLLVPLLGAYFFGHSVSSTVKLGVALATPGLFLLCTNGSFSLNRGDLLAAVCAICVSLHLLLTGIFARDCDVFWLTTVQLGTVAILSLTVAQTTGHNAFNWHADILWALVICAVFATVFAFLVQTSMQRVLSPAHTALIFCLEPVFAALYAWWAANEQLGLPGFIGAVLILCGMVVSELPAIRSKKPALT